MQKTMPEISAGRHTLSLQGERMSKQLTPEDFERAAAALGCDIASIRAVIEVESSGSGFANGVPKILFERHVFRRQLRAKGYPTELLEKKYPDLVNVKPGGYATGPDAKSRQANEHLRLDRAAQINREAALEACSWGAFQVLGMHWKALGYRSLQEFINSMYRDEASHLDSFVRYIKATPVALKALRQKDWTAFAVAYNGPAQNGYDERIESAVKKYTA
ncbi:N-acetylmuramidase [compost metagenome]